MRKHAIKLSVMVSVFWMAIHASFSQTPTQPPEESIAVMARPSKDSITLRWAPMYYDAWQRGNAFGYRIERYVMARQGTLLAEAEKQTLHAAVKPLPVHQWEDLVSDNRYAAIAAQALFGDRFELDLKNSDVFTVVNKARENDQRFSFALFSADMSTKVAVASGLMFTDRNIRKGEQYLYRIIINTADSLRGSVFIRPDDPYTLPAPQNLTADFNGALVYLKWNKNINADYTAYVVERSTDGKHFESISNTPLVTISPTASEDTRFNYAIDSVRDLSQTMYYRIRGITPFGDESQPSAVVSGKGTPIVEGVPYISSVDNAHNESLHIRWEFSHENNAAIKGFAVERASNPNEKFSPLTNPLLGSETRAYEDRNPGQVNYYRVTALGLDGVLYPSPVFYGQLVDSIPPAPPEELKASINDEGVVALSWKANAEPDIYGYRIYKANYKSEELAQITTSPVGAPSFSDQVDLNTLNEYVYYQVMALDQNQNHSKLSALLEVVLPDKVPPQPPVLLPVKNMHDGVGLSWIGSASEDVTGYRVYRKAPEESQWQLITVVENKNDTIIYYKDEGIQIAKENLYTVLSVDEAGQESEPTQPVRGTRIDNHLRPAVKWKKPFFIREENQVSLRWVTAQKEIQSFQIYRAVLNNAHVLYRILPGNAAEFRDTLRPTQDYTYRIMAVLPDGRKTALSEALFVDY